MNGRDFPPIGQGHLDVESRLQGGSVADDDREIESPVAADLNPVIHGIQEVLQLQKAVIRIVPVDGRALEVAEDPLARAGIDAPAQKLGRKRAPHGVDVFARVVELQRLQEVPQAVAEDLGASTVALVGLDLREKPGFPEFAFRHDPLPEPQFEEDLRNG